jgi:plastocyanin
MTRFRALSMAATIAVLTAAAPSAHATTTRNVEAATNYFAPATVQAVAGDTIRWTVTQGSHNVATYAGSASFTSPMMSQASAPYDHVYQGGVILYRCTPHSSLSSSGKCVGMCGAITDRVGAPATPTITSPAEGAHLTSDTVTFRGNGQSFSTVRLTESGLTLGEALVRSDGTWQVSLRLAEGDHTVAARAYDPDGTASASSSSVSFTLSTAVPDTMKPTVVITNEEVAAIVGPWRIDGLAADDTGVASITVRVTDLNGVQVASSLATCTDCVATGVAWWIDLPLPSGIYQATAVAKDTSGNISAPSRPIRAVVIATP